MEESFIEMQVLIIEAEKSNDLAMELEHNNNTVGRKKNRMNDSYYTTESIELTESRYGN